MRLRTRPHKASVAAGSYTVGERSVRLLPLPLFTPGPLQDLQRRIVAAAPDVGEGEAHLRASAILLFHCWDDPEVEWETSADPDAVMGLDDAALVALSASLMAEMLARPVYRLGMAPYSGGVSLTAPSLLRAAAFLNAGLTETTKAATPETTTPGEATPPTPGT